MNRFSSRVSPLLLELDEVSPTFLAAPEPICAGYYLLKMSVDKAKETEVIVAVQQARYRQQQAFDNEDDTYVKAHSYHKAQP